MALEAGLGPEGGVALAAMFQGDILQAPGLALVGCAEVLGDLDRYFSRLVNV